MLKKENTFTRIYEVVRRIPRGKVATYGQIAMLAGNPHWSQVVGYALHVNPDPAGIPCYRVVNRFGEVSRAFAFGGDNEQRRLLEAEGVAFLPDGRVDLKHFLWQPDGTEF
ncbi:MAG: MGMT family protein [Clostridia bacterium]|nr:MGMT family protein [Clostridia bacterium]